MKHRKGYAASGVWSDWPRPTVKRHRHRNGTADVFLLSPMGIIVCNRLIRHPRKGNPR